MGFRRTPDEIAAIQQTLSDVEFVGGESLSVDFLTRPELVRALLPAELEPGDTPRITAQVSRWRSNCVGDFDASAIYVSARYGEVAGDYVLTMFMDSDVPMLFGRDLFGEPKKIGRSTIYRNDGHMTGVLERGGARLIEIEADLGPDNGPTTVLGRNYNVKYELAPDGSALVGSPTLTMAEFDQRITVRRKTVDATLRLGSTVHDPLGDLEVVELLGGVYVETGMKASCVPVGTMDADAFLPLALGRSDYWPALVTARLPQPACPSPPEPARPNLQHNERTSWTSRCPRRPRTTAAACGTSCGRRCSRPRPSGRRTSSSTASTPTRR